MAKGSRPTNNNLVRAGDKSEFGWQTARYAKVIDVKTQDNYLGDTDYTVQTYTLRRPDGKVATGQHFISYRGDKDVETYKPVVKGQNVIAWWPDRRRGINYASIANNKRGQ